MSELLLHECGVVLLRLRKPLSYYVQKYGSPMYALRKLYLLMHKQHNRGQDGAGIASLQLNKPPGTHYVQRWRSIAAQPLKDLFTRFERDFSCQAPYKNTHDLASLEKQLARGQQHCPFLGELLIGHLRYSTHGIPNQLSQCHPFIRHSHWRNQNLILAGNFNMANQETLFQKLISYGQHPKEHTDTVTVMEKIGYHLSKEAERQFQICEAMGKNYHETTQYIESHINLQKVLSGACHDFDGGYVLVGAVGYGQGFALRDPYGIRPAYYYWDDEIVVVTSEKPPIKTAFGVPFNEIKPLPPGQVLLCDADGAPQLQTFAEPQTPKPCSFERIYFSRASDPHIYEERKQLGKNLVPDVLHALKEDHLVNVVFSYVPNTAEVAFLGMMEGLRHETNQPLRTEHLVSKDMKMRTFIAEDKGRDELVNHTYDTTYDLIRPQQDTLVILDDSIVRGTTLRQSILPLLSTLHPKRIIVVSSSPQIRYPDCYGIDMSQIGQFIAFNALMSLLSENTYEKILQEVYLDCIKAAALSPDTPEPNHVRKLYELFSAQTLSTRMAQLLSDKTYNVPLHLLFQRVEGLHAACPHHKGDWYFTGQYPTPYGSRVANQAFVRYMDSSGTKKVRQTTS